ncbi:MAG: MFS transporter [Candidatus Saccharimonadaceae bacterium]
MNNKSLILLVAILASFVAFLDGSVVGVALPQISEQLGGGLSTQQWVNDAYLITLGSLILAAGSLSDIFGRKKIIMYGLVGFLITSILCAIAPTNEVLIISRALQGIAGALLVPSSLALIIGAFSGQAQAKAIGSWTAWTGVAFIIGPLVGGLLVDYLSWRWVFIINVIPIAIALILLGKLHFDEQLNQSKSLDILGISLGAVGLGGIVFALIEQGNYGWMSPVVWVTFTIGVVCLISFIYHESKTKYPMLPLNLFSVRNFSAGNIATFFIYSALSLQGFILVIFLQQVAGYTATLAGLVSLPVTILMLILSSKFGALAGKYGPRLFMTLGPIISSIGVFYMLNVQIPVNYWLQLLPGIILFGIGLSVTVAPLTSAVLGSIKTSQAGIGSAVNNAIARIAGLLAVAIIGLFAGTSLDLEGFRAGIVICATLLFIGGLVSFIGIKNSSKLAH